MYICVTVFVCVGGGYVKNDLGGEHPGERTSNKRWMVFFELRKSSGEGREYKASIAYL